jgi:hypothetical protein
MEHDLFRKPVSTFPDHALSSGRRWAAAEYALPPATGFTAPLFVMLPQIVVQRSAARFLEQIFQHQILAAALGKTFAVLFAERRHFGVAVLALDFAALVAVPIIEATL